MALVADSTALTFGVAGAASRAIRWVAGFFNPAPYSPEADLLLGTLRDSRLAPQAPMSNEQIDVGTLAQLSNAGLKRGKLVTEETHPELMQAWKAMAKRAGLERTPQLIIADSPIMNALTLNANEVAITTGLLKILDLRETVAVLGHELGHASSNHLATRIGANAVLMGTGVAVGDRFSHIGGMSRLISKSRWADNKVVNWFFDKHIPGQSSSTLHSLFYMGAGAGVGMLLANQLTVRPTELDADAKGAAISGDPQGLALALRALQGHAHRGGAAGFIRHAVSGYPTMDTRIQRLEGMAAAGHPPAVLAAQVAVAPAPLADKPGAAVQQVMAAERVQPLAEGQALS